MALKVGFHANQMGLRGTEIALFDYALYNQILLGNESVIFYNPNVPVNDLTVIEKFKSNFELVPYSDFSEVRRLAHNKQIDAMYLIKSGERDGRFFSEIPSLIHAVFPQAPIERHGHTYAFVSEWLSKEFSHFKTPYVPHITKLPTIESNLRKTLNIPANALVLGCHGGHDSFNIEFAKKVVLNMLEKRKDLFFVFLNIAPFGQHEKLIFLPGNANLEYKTQFINTCDAMLHARNCGETFGLACAEFSLRNKPVLTYDLSPERSHLEILGQKAIRYSNSKELQNIILNLDYKSIKTKNWDCYSEVFSPKKVMEKFDSVFLGSLTNQIPHEPIFNAVDTAYIQTYKLKRKWRSFLKKIYKLIY
jgi:hypothetical protein